MTSRRQRVMLPGGFIATGVEMRAWLREAGFRETTFQQVTDI
jgi:hypothetical protein